MKTRGKSLPTDVDSLTKMVLQLQAKLSEQSNYIQQLIETIQLTRHQHFGTRSEKSNVDQLSLLFNEAEALADGEGANTENNEEALTQEESTVIQSKQRRTGGRKKLHDHYPRVEIVYTLEGDECCCDQCSQPLAPMGEKVSEQIDIIPLTVNVIRHIRKTYHYLKV